MTPLNSVGSDSLQLSLTRLIGKKDIASTDASTATLSDFHRYVNDKHLKWEQTNEEFIELSWTDENWKHYFDYDS